MLKYLLSSAAVVLTAYPVLFFNKPIGTEQNVVKRIDYFIQTTPSLPRYMEGGICPLGRSPVVDVLLSDPFYGPKYAETVSAVIPESSSSFRFFFVEQCLRAGGVPAAEVNAAEVLVVRCAAPDKFLSAFPLPIANRLYGYWTAFLSVHQEVEAILSVLSAEEKKWVKDNYSRFFFGEEKEGIEYDFFTSDNLGITSIREGSP